MLTPSHDGSVRDENFSTVGKFVIGLEMWLQYFSSSGFVVHVACEFNIACY